MTILVDQAIWPFRGRKWAHLVSDESYDELHAFAEKMGIPREAFQGDHYDIPEDYHQLAITLGAEFVDARELARRLRGAGLRIEKRYTGPGAVPDRNPPGPAATIKPITEAPGARRAPDE
jgi:hypothetical protein